MKKLLSLVLSFLLLASLCPALADTPPADQIAASGESVVEWYNKARANDNLISYTKAGISAGTDYVYVVGITEAYSVIDTVGVVYIIQRWENAQWTDYYTLGRYNYDNWEVNDSRTIDVEGGHYYRLYSIHRALDGVLDDFVYSITSSIYVN